MGQKGHLLQPRQVEQDWVAWRAEQPRTPASSLPSVVPARQRLSHQGWSSHPSWKAGCICGRDGGATGQPSSQDVPEKASEHTGTKGHPGISEHAPAHAITMPTQWS